MGPVLGQGQQNIIFVRDGTGPQIEKINGTGHVPSVLHPCLQHLWNKILPITHTKFLYAYENGSELKVLKILSNF